MFIHSPQHLLNVHCRPLTEMKKPNLDLGVLKDITKEKEGKYTHSKFIIGKQVDR